MAPEALVNDGGPVDKTISSPAQLADAFRQSGGFDALRRNLMQEFMASSDKELFMSRLDEIIQNSIARPTFKTVGKKERHMALVKDVETRHPVLVKAVAEMERSVRAREKEKEAKGRMGNISRQLDMTLRRSRGEIVADEEQDDVEESAPTSLAPAPELAEVSPTSQELPQADVKTEDTTEIFPTPLKAENQIALSSSEPSRLPPAGDLSTPYPANVPSTTDLATLSPGGSHAVEEKPLLEEEKPLVKEDEVAKSPVKTEEEEPMVVDNRFATLNASEPSVDSMDTSSA
ncbi:hypothetical protein T439DRAFT_326474 [Meredithblackwellia eburnea MCA 4105]